GYYDGAHPFRSQEIYVSRTSDQRPRKVRCAAIQCDYLEELGAPQRFSPDGRYAVVQLRPAVNTAEEIPTEWKRYTDFSMRHAIHSGIVTALAQRAIVDVEQAVIRPLWNAPNEPIFDDSNVTLLWSHDSSR